MFKQMNPHLRKFLWERNLYFRFMINLIVSAEGIDDYIKRRSSLSTPKSYAISSAFDWYKSFEGEFYWNSVNRKWEIWYGMLLNAGVIDPTIYTEPDENEKSNI
jgi:hypothetical protein